MTKQTINIGTVANDGTGDPVRTAFTKINENFTEVYGELVTLTSELTNDFGYITANSLPTNISDLTNDVGYLTSNTIPTLVSSFINDAEYITANTNNIVLLGRYTLGTPVVFSNVANTLLTDTIDTGLTLARDMLGGAIYNSEQETTYDSINRLSPLGTSWNPDGFENLDTIKNRNYTTFSIALSNAVGNNILTADLIMHDTINDKYYKFEFSNWGQHNAGTFAYTRTEIIISDIGITFPDGTIQPSAWTGTISKYDLVYIGEYSGHELSLEETGSAIYFYNTHITLTSNTENACPVGSFYTLVAGNAPVSLRIKQYADTSIIPVIDSQLLSSTDVYSNVNYDLEPNSISLLVKTKPNKWTLSPAGLQTTLKGSVYSVSNNLLVDGNSGKIIADVETSLDWSVNVANNIWSFDSTGNVTFPDGEVQSSAYSGGNGRMLMIDTNRNDSYTEIGSADKPFKTFGAAIEAASSSTETSYTFVLMGCTVSENVSFANTDFTSITIATTCRSIISGNITIDSIPSLSQMAFRNVEVGGDFLISGDGTLNQMNSVSFYNASFSGAVNITAANSIAFYEAAFFGTVNFTNVNYMYINGAQFNSDLTFNIDDSGISAIPSSGISPAIVVGFNFIANHVYTTKTGANSGFLVLQPHMSRMGRSDGQYTIPTNFVFQPQGCAIRGTWTNNGSTTLRNSSFDVAIRGTAPVYTGIIGGDRVVVDGIPLTSAGVIGDRAGMIASDGNYLYVCTANWISPGLVDIWSRTALSASNW